MPINCLCTLIFNEEACQNCILNMGRLCGFPELLIIWYCIYNFTLSSGSILTHQFFVYGTMYR